MGSLGYTDKGGSCLYDNSAIDRKVGTLNCNILAVLEHDVQLDLSQAQRYLRLVVCRREDGGSRV